MKITQIKSSCPYGNLWAASIDRGRYSFLQLLTALSVRLACAALSFGHLRAVTILSGLFRHSSAWPIVGTDLKQAVLRGQTVWLFRASEWG